MNTYKLIKYEKKKNGLYSIYYINDKCLGYFVIDDDGYFYYWLNQALYGCWSAEILKNIAELLDIFNEEWHRKPSICMEENSNE